MTKSVEPTFENITKAGINDIENGYMMCGGNHPACLQFHHRDKSEKSFNVADRASRASSKERLFDEIKKCDVLCVNCHAKIHWRETHETDSWEEILSQGE